MNPEPEVQHIVEANEVEVVIAIAASAGGLAALIKLLSFFQPDFRAAIVVVQHLAPHHASLMAEILGHNTLLHVKQAEAGDRVNPATVYIAPPDRHLLINPGGSLSLSQTDPVHFLRPSADILFESLASSYHKRAIAVVLTGTGSDGSIGVQAVKMMGGTVIVQSEQSAEFSGMPTSAIRTNSVDFILPLDEIAATLVALVAKGSSK